MHKYDLHVHTLETSPCGRVKGAEIAKLYKENGYSGIVVTDHYTGRFFRKVRKFRWKSKVDRFLAGYREVKRVGDEIGLNVFLGMELRFKWSLNDYLVYGLDQQFIYRESQLQKMKLSEFREFTSDSNVLIYQAHPYRIGMTRADIEFIDGIEVFNGNPRYNSRNNLAYEFATKNNLKMISGSDFHQLDDLAKGGVIFRKNPDNESELVELLKSNEYVELIGVK